jgi:glycosyltransferase involved in cell wall biosynthesis
MRGRYNDAMRIGVDARITYYTRGGISTYTLRLIEALARLDTATDYCILRSRKEPNPLQSSPNLNSVACWTPSHNRLERWALGVEITRLGLDLLHSPDFIPPAFGYRRSIITVHDLNFLHYPQFLTKQSLRYYNGQIEWATQRTDHIRADSHATKADLVSMLSVPSEKATVVHLAADPAYSPMPLEESSRAVAKYDLEPGYLLFVGTLEPRKNLPGLLQAYRLLIDAKATDEPLVLVGGKGWLYDEVFERVEHLQLTRRVRFLHTVPNADLRALYSAASLLVTPSFYEGFGLPALEAMACGTPAVVSDRASLPEVVGEAGLLVNPDDAEDIAQALARVLADDLLRARMREDGLAQAARFSWERTARETLNVYRRMLEA